MNACQMSLLAVLAGIFIIFIFHLEQAKTLGLSGYATN